MKNEPRQGDEEAKFGAAAVAPEGNAASRQLEPRPTINDVARRCGLSKATISKALNMSEADSPVNAHTRQFVLEVAHEMGYRPNFRARSLTHGRSNAIGLLHEQSAPNMSGVYSALTYAFAQTLLDSGFHLTLVPTVGRAEQWNHVLLDSRLDGCVVFNHLTPEMEAVLTQAQLPTVLLNVGPNPALSASPWPCLAVDPDDKGGTELVTRHLLDLGHRRITFFEDDSSDPHPSRTQRRTNFLEMMQREGLAQDAEVRAESAADFVSRFVASPHRPTAVIAYDHPNAILLMNELWQRGVQVPHDLSLATFNDVYPVAHLTPPLTVVRVPSAEMGREAARLLLECILEGAVPQQPQLMLPETLVVRQSTRALAASQQ